MSYWVNDTSTSNVSAFNDIEITGENCYRIWGSDNSTVSNTDFTYTDHNFQPDLLNGYNFFAYVRTEEEVKKEREQMLKAQETARGLLEILVPEDRLTQLKKERRIEILARNGNIYEILEDGKVNKLLPDDKKQGLCINLTNGPYPTDDIVLAKLLLLENDPEKFEEVANKVSPFQLVA